MSSSHTPNEQNVVGDQITAALRTIGHVASSMRLESLRVTAGSFSLSTDIHGYPEDPLDVSAHALFSAKENRVTSDIRFRYREAPEFLKDEGRGIEIFERFELVYQYIHEGDLSQENAELFGKVNGIYNVWPYWREFVQSMTARLSLPPLTMPLITAPQAISWIIGTELQK